MISTDKRAEIVTDFAKRHEGIFDPRVFLEEVEKEGVAHPAHDWFEWDQSRAAFEFRLSQARDFVHGLTITVEVKTIKSGEIRIVREKAPLALAPLGLRSHGGGYVIAGPKNPGYLDELKRQAATRLSSFVERYTPALVSAGIETADLEAMIAQLEADAEGEAEAA